MTGRHGSDQTGRTENTSQVYGLRHSCHPHTHRPQGGKPGGEFAVIGGDSAQLESTEGETEVLFEESVRSEATKLRIPLSSWLH